MLVVVLRNVASYGRFGVQGGRGYGDTAIKSIVTRCCYAEECYQNNLSQRGVLVDHGTCQKRRRSDYRKPLRTPQTHNTAPRLH